ncbi:uncharacterized protein [Dysidea avara]|uniref:uncharacterized protein isoform X2 n=1 Tax=Dysidea avara TaxID=196820 RepID=UPI0033232185
MASPNLVPLKGVKHMQDTELGCGAYGRVYKVKYNGKICAAKMIHPILVEHRVSAEQRNHIINAFRRECSHCSTLNHPNVVEFFGISNPTWLSKIPVMVMELMDESLTKFIERKPLGQISFFTKISILLDIARGLNYLHSQQPAVVHRDLSPNNILLKDLTKTGAVLIAKIADLGVAKVIEVDSKETRSRLSKAPGTVAFMPPEATKDNPIYGLPLDIFSFGGIILFVATQEWPKPTDLIETDPDTGKVTAFTEVERRQKYLNKMTEAMEMLKPLVVSCLNNSPSKRPAMEDIPAHLEPLLRRKPHASKEEDYVDLDLTGERENDKKKSDLSKASLDDIDIPAGKKKPKQEHSSSHLWYVGCLPCNKAENLVKDLYDGVFLVREDNENKGQYEICVRWKKKPHHLTIFIDPKTHNFYVAKQKMFSTIYELVGYYQEHSLNSAFPEIATMLKYAYYIIVSPPKRPIELPWPISPQNLPRDINALSLSVQAPVQLLDEGDLKPNRRKFTEIWSNFRNKQQSYGNQSSFPRVNNPVEEPWYHGEISRDDAVELLSEDGDYLVRYSDNQRCYVLTAMCEGEAKHFIISNKRQGHGFSLCGPVFPSISDLIKHYTETPSPVSDQSQTKFILKRAVCEQIDNNQYFLQHKDLLLDREPFHKGSRCYVYSAILKDSGMQVAVKVCHTEKQQFLCEAKLLEKFNHHNIVKLLSLCVDGDPTHVVLELMSGGDFLVFLRKNGVYQTQYQLTKFSLDAAQGMEYLASQNCLHRNLTAKSCLVGNNNEVLKISDFSMCKMAEKRMYSQADTAEQFATKWIAPEMFELGVYTTASDVWSYGILLFEIFSNGSVPYVGISDKDILEYLKQGHRLKSPERAPKEVYHEIMRQCWRYPPKDRPTFQDVVVKLADVLTGLPRT